MRTLAIAWLLSASAVLWSATASVPQANAQPACPLLLSVTLTARPESPGVVRVTWTSETAAGTAGTAGGQPCEPIGSVGKIYFWLQSPQTQRVTGVAGSFAD